MKKIVAIIGTGKKVNSNTYEFTKEILDSVSNLDEKINFKIISTADKKLMTCKGCEICFNKGACVLEKEDYMEIIKQELLDSDMVIFASPVYAHNVSADMKIVIDRLCSWMHLLKLAGKKAITISTATSNGNEYVNKYLRKIFTYLGADVVLDIKYRQVEKDKRKSIIEETSREIVRNINSDVININPYQEGIFNTFKNIYKLQEKTSDENKFEIEYWKKSGLMNCKSYREYIEIYK